MDTSLAGHEAPLYVAGVNAIDLAAAEMDILVIEGIKPFEHLVHSLVDVIDEMSPASSVT